MSSLLEEPASLVASINKSIKSEAEEYFYRYFKLETDRAALERGGISGIPLRLRQRIQHVEHCYAIQSVRYSEIGIWEIQHARDLSNCDDVLNILPGLIKLTLRLHVYITQPSSQQCFDGEELINAAALEIMPLVRRVWQFDIIYEAYVCGTNYLGPYERSVMFVFGGEKVELSCSSMYVEESHFLGYTMFVKRLKERMQALLVEEGTVTRVL